MAPLPQNSTTRYFFDYVTGNATTSTEHTIAMRVNPAIVDPPTACAGLLAVLTAWTNGNFRSGWRVIRGRVQAAGSNFSVPITLTTALANFVGTLSTGYVARLEAVEDTFQGRSLTTGRRVDLSFYRAATDPTDNFRVVAGGSGLNLTVQNVRNAIQAEVANGMFLAIDQSQPTYSAYMNQNYNSYWERRIRTV